MTDSEWKIFETLLPPKPDTLRGRPQENSRRNIVDGILYMIRTGGSWRMMPSDLPHWKTCYHYFRLWAKLGYWEKKPRPLRLSMVKAFGQLASPEFVAMMRVRKLQEESAIFW
jgi:putative transposase